MNREEIADFKSKLRKLARKYKFQPHPEFDSENYLYHYYEYETNMEITYVEDVCESGHYDAELCFYGDSGQESSFGIDDRGLLELEKEIKNELDYYVETENN